MSEGITIGRYTTHAPQLVDARISLLLWGTAGCGKTTLASTAPGRKLWILFDPDGDRSLVGNSDIQVWDLSGEKHIITSNFKDDNPFQLERIIKDNNIDTVVFDSLTSYGILATEAAVSGTKSATLENPGLKGYGMRNAIVLRTCISLMRLTKRLGKHIIMIAHEDAPAMTEDGHVMHITVALGGKMTSSLGMQLSEIWWLNDTGKEHRIAVRNVRNRQPMKSRMWIAKDGEFVWRYDPITRVGDGIATWHKMWVDNAGQKVPLPK